MPRRNRVAPTGEILAVAQRGAWMGNRGCLVDAGGELVRTWRSRAWITCVTSFEGRRLPLGDSGRNTQLFFLDEAVALAAGHRPCAACRRADFDRFRDAWASAFGSRPRAPELDAALDADRRQGPVQRRHRQLWPELPDGTYVWLDGGPAVVAGARVVPWTASGYGPPRGRPPDGGVEVVTPRCTVAVLAAGYEPQLGIAVSSPPGG